MKQQATILIIIFLSIARLTFACDCESQGSFLAVAPKSKLVALVKVINYLTFKNIYNKQTPISMKVEIVKVYNGEETRKTVNVWGDDGTQCRPYLNIFKVDNYYVIAFEQDSKVSPIDYTISNCGDYWLTADNIKKIAIGQVNEKQKQITYAALSRYFNEGKTKELTPQDFKELYQLALDLPKLQQYFHVDTDTSRKQIVIQYFGEANHNNLKGVIKFDKQISILTEEEIKKRQIKYYFVLGDWVCLQNRVRMQLSYVGEGLTASYMFKKIDDKWIILGSELWEE